MSLRFKTFEDSNDATKVLKRRIIQKGSIDHKRFDSFIQNSLNKYSFVEPWKVLYDVTGTHSSLIVSNKSAIPDLVIYHKIFNKNECFIDNKSTVFNAFPR